MSLLTFFKLLAMCMNDDERLQPRTRHVKRVSRPATQKRPKPRCRYYLFIYFLFCICWTEYIWLLATCWDRQRTPTTTKSATRRWRRGSRHVSSPGKLLFGFFLFLVSILITFLGQRLPKWPPPHHNMSHPSRPLNKSLGTRTTTVGPETRLGL